MKIKTSFYSISSEKGVNAFRLFLEFKKWLRSWREYGNFQFNTCTGLQTYFIYNNKFFQVNQRDILNTNIFLGNKNYDIFYIAL